MTKKIISLILSLCLLSAACIIPAAAYGEEAPADEDLFMLAADPQSGDLTITSDDSDTPSAAYFTVVQDGGESAYPSSYDPRSSYTLPEVRNQGSWNTCWLMAAIGTSEFSGLGQTDISGRNYSERHLIYFATHQADDPLGNSSGDYNTNTSYWIKYGGNPTLAMMTLSGWHGIASEDATNTPYSGLSASDNIDSAYAYTDVLHLENAMAMNLSTASDREALKGMILTYGSAVMSMYFSSSYLYSGTITTQTIDGAAADTASDEPVITDTDASAEMQESADVSDAAETAEELPETDQPQADPEEPAAAAEDTEIPEETQEVQPETEIVEIEEELPEDNGSGVTYAAMDGIAEEEMFPDETAVEEPAADTDTAAAVNDGAGAETPAEDGEYTVCYYQDSVTSTNHEVLVIGWDDDYPAKNFANSTKGVQPAGNGAWLCRNSYGANWPETGAGGYFWVSYYDASVSYDGMGKLEQTRAVVFDYGSADNYDNNYEYDGAAVQGYINDAIGSKGVSTTTASASTTRSYANVFTASACELRGSELLQAVSTYTYRESVPYTVTVYTNLTDPTNPTSGTQAATQSGTFDYAGFHTVELSSPVTLTLGETYSVVFKVGASADLSVFVPASYTFSSWNSVDDSAAGQSFVSLDGTTWYDCQDLTRKGNVRIKAYTDTVAAIFPFTDVASDKWYYSDIDRAWRVGLVEGTSSDTYSPNSVATRAAAVTLLYRLAGSPETTGEVTFDDIGSTQYYYNAVCWAQKNGLVTGSDDDGDGVYSFRPNDGLTRLELVTILYRYAKMAGLDTSSFNSLRTFADTPTVAAWGLAAEQWSVGCGIQLGSLNDDGSLSLLPYSSVTRAMLAAYFVRLYDLK